MKVFISADIEGIATTLSWEDCEAGHAAYPRNAEQMTREVAAACEGAVAAGADEIVVKDAHDTGNNIDATKLPECVRVTKGWSGHPYSMVEGIDSTFDAALFVGYHSAAGEAGNPLSHTLDLSAARISINGVPASEFTLFSYAAAKENVPTVFLSGDERLCAAGREMYPGLFSVAVKEGMGGALRCLSPLRVVRSIREETEKSLKQDLRRARIRLPESYSVEIRYKDHALAKRKSFYPGMRQINATGLLFETGDYFEVLRMLQFAL